MLIDYSNPKDIARIVLQCHEWRYGREIAGYKGARARFTAAAERAAREIPSYFDHGDENQLFRAVARFITTIGNLWENSREVGMLVGVGILRDFGWFSKEELNLDAAIQSNRDEDVADLLLRHRRFQKK